MSHSENFVTFSLIGTEKAFYDAVPDSESLDWTIWLSSSRDREALGCPELRPLPHFANKR